MTAFTLPADAGSRGRPRRAGPALSVPAVIWAVLTLVAVPTYPSVRPDGSAAQALHAVHVSSTASLSAMLVLASGVPLVVWSAAVMHRLRTTLDARAAGPVIALSGGVLAAVALAISGLASWTAADASASGDAALVDALTRLAFAAGGPLFAVALGLGVAGAAVPSLVLGLLPRWLAVLGLLIGAVGAVGVLALVVPVLSPALPVVRFGGLLWIVTVSWLLPSHRPASAERPAR